MALIDVSSSLELEDKPRSTGDADPGECRVVNLADCLELFDQHV